MTKVAHRAMQLCCIACALIVGACSQAPTQSLALLAPTPIKVVVISMFEHGAVTGDEPGEFQLWVEQTPLPTKHDFPAGPFPLYSNDQGVLGICVGGWSLDAIHFPLNRQLAAWANDWVKLYAGADANFVTSNMEDSGTLTALKRLGNLGKLNPERTLVLRTVSNYTTPPNDMPATSSATQEYPNSGLPSLTAAFQVGNTVVQALLAGEYTN